MKKISLTQLAREHIAKNYVRGLSKAAIARQLMERFPSRFINFENTNSVVRYVINGRKKKSEQINYQPYVKLYDAIIQDKNADGESLDDILKDSDDFLDSISQHKENLAYKSELPDSYSYISYDKYFKIKDSERLLILGDIHCPFQDNDALRQAVLFGLEKDVDAVLLNGDVVDFFNISSFVKDEDIVSIEEELTSVKKFFKYLRTVFGSEVKIYYKIGNHEDRFQKYLATHAPELLGADFISLPKLLDLEKYHIEFVDSKQIIQYGKSLHIIHGHEFRTGFGHPVNPARTLFTKMKVCTIGGHFHQISKHSETRGDGSQIACWSHGCLCSLNPKYAILNNWSHGFAYAELYHDGTFHVENREIINNRVV